VQALAVRLHLTHCRVASCAAISFACASMATAAELRDESQYWVPAFSLYFDAHGQKLEGSVTTGPVLGPPLSDGGCLDSSDGSRDPGELCPSGRPNKEQILADDTGGDTSVSPLVGASLELMTPALTERFLRPRLFAHADLASAFSFERTVAGIESPGPFEFPPIFLSQNDDPLAVRFDELSIFGQGSRARVQLERWVWSAGLGAAFGFDVLGRRVRVKPSLEYLHQELELIGTVHRAVKLKHPQVSVVDFRDFRLLQLSGTETESYDGIGPGLEVEADAARLGPFVSSVYATARGYYLLGDLDTEFSASNEFGETATWSFEPQRWVWRAGVGLRFRWLPEAE